MAIVFNCAQDWTFDRFKFDIDTVKNGGTVQDEYRDEFARWLIARADRVKAEWLGRHKGLYDSVDGWVGDRFANSYMGDFFSDYYKDAYGQRPHLPRWYYVHALGLPQTEDTARLFCANPVQEAVENAELTRRNFD